MAFLPQKELIIHLQRLREEIGQLGIALRGVLGQQPSAGQGHAQSDAAQVKQSPAANTPVIAARLRIEDLKPPPAKRQKQNPKVKDEKVSPAAGSPIKIKTDAESTGNAASPPQTKRPVPKRKRKPTNNGMPQEPIDVDAAESTPVDLTASPAQMESGTAQVAAPKRDSLLSAPPDNILGVRLGEQMVQARIKADHDAQSDPVAYLASQWKRLESVLSRHDQSVLDAVNADLAIDVPVPFDDSLGTFTVRMRAAQAVPAARPLAAKMASAPPPVTEGFDYSSFIDFSAFEEEDESAPTVIAATPDLLGPGDPRFEVSPSSEGATGTPRHVAPVHHHRAPIGTVSPVQQHVDLFGEDGWLTEGLADSKWDEGFDPNPSHWNLSSL